MIDLQRPVGVFNECHSFRHRCRIVNFEKSLCFYTIISRAFLHIKPVRDNHVVSYWQYAAEELRNVRKRVEAVQQRLSKHNEIEETGIYRWTSMLLTEAEQLELAALIEKELANTSARFR